jgi:hypothetical protein
VLRLSASTTFTYLLCNVTLQELEVRTAGGGGGANVCTMYLLALDGVYLFGGPRATTMVAFAPATRASVAIACA